MAKPQNKSEFQSYIKRKLGSPIIEIEITPDQFDDIIDEAVNFYCENVYEGQKDAAYLINLLDGTLEYVLNDIPGLENLYSVTEVVDPTSAGYIFPSNYGITPADVDWLVSLGRLEGNNLVDYEIAMEKISAIEHVVVPRTEWNYNFNTGILRFSTNPYDRTNKVVLLCSILLDYDGNSTGKFWSNKWLIEYATSMVGMQWMQNLRKFSGLNIPGGGEINDRYSEFKDEKDRLELYAVESLSYAPSAFVPYLA